MVHMWCKYDVCVYVVFYGVWSGIYAYDVHLVHVHVPVCVMCAQLSAITVSRSLGRPFLVSTSGKPVLDLGGWQYRASPSLPIPWDFPMASV